MSNSQFSLDGKLTRQNIYQKLKKYQVTKRKKKPKFIYCLKNPSKLPIWTFSIYKSLHNSVSSNLNYNPENNPQLRNVDSFEIFHVREELYLKIQYNTQKQTKTRNIDSLKKKEFIEISREEIYSEIFHWHRVLRPYMIRLRAMKQQFFIRKPPRVASKLIWRGRRHVTSQINDRTTAG